MEAGRSELYKDLLLCYVRVENGIRHSKTWKLSVKVIHVCRPTMHPHHAYIQPSFLSPM